MSFNKRFLYDVFISYASVNNLADPLVSEFRQRLKQQLGGLGISDGLEIYFDQGDVDDGSPLPKQILGAAHSSAVMICFHSPAYDRSIKWCHREFFEFRGGQPDWENHLFLVALNRDTTPSDSPVFKGFASRHHRSFFEVRGEHWFTFRTTEPTMINPEGFDFDDEVVLLAQQIARRLQALQAQAPIKKVFLTCASDTFIKQADDIEKGLVAHGIHVLQTSPWSEPNTRKEFAERYIQQADLVIGIEESFAGYDAVRIHAAEQVAIAEQLGKPQLRWLPDEGHGFTPEQYEERKTRAGVKKISLEQIKNMAIERILKPKAEATLPPNPAPIAVGGNEPPTSPPLILVVCAAEDKSIAGDAIIQFIDGENIGHYRHVDTRDCSDPTEAAAWSTELKELIAQLEATKVIFVDGNCQDTWIDPRLRNFWALKRDLTPRPPVALCDWLPLPKKPSRNFRPLGRLPIVEYNQPEKLRDFLRS